MERRTVYLGLLFVLLLSIGRRSDDIRIRSWAQAIEFTQKELAQSGDLAGRLEHYDHLTTELNDAIQALDHTRPALESIQSLRDIEVPLVGDGWQILLFFISLSSVDGARTLERLEQTLRELVEFKQALGDLSGISETAAAVYAFQETPNKQTLIQLSTACEKYAPSLKQTHAELGQALEPIQDVADKVSGLTDGLHKASQSGIPLISDVASETGQGIRAMQDPLLELRDKLEQLDVDIQADLRLMDRIQKATRQAQKYDKGERSKSKETQ